MPNNKGYKIGLKTVNGGLIGLKYFKVDEIKHFVPADSTNFISGVENAEKIVAILPPELVSYKFLSYPFSLKNKKNTELLVKTALEELTPLNIDEIVILKHKLSNNSLFIEYIKKKNIIDLLTKYNLLNIKKNIKIYFPYSLLYKISKGLEINWTENSALVYDFANETYGIVIKNNIFSEIINLNYINSLTALSLENINGFDELENLTVYNLNEKCREIYGRGQVDSSKPDEFSKSTDILNSNYSDLMFLLDSENYKNNLPHLNSDTIFKKTGDYSDIFSKVIPAFFLVLFALILTIFGLAENFYYKNNEKTILEKKINTILSKYMPQQKVFYEPRYEIKRYYDKLKENSSSYSGGANFLKFLKYISEEKGNLNSLTVGGINYSYNKFNFKGAVKGYKNLHRFERYLKKKYSTVDVIKSYKNSKGFVNFNIVLKK
jgi:hypothetical protein